MKKFFYAIMVLFLGILMFVNLNLTLNETSGKLSTLTLDALGQIYDLEDLPGATITCAASDDRCFLPVGCRCYNAEFGTCPKCNDMYTYFCKWSGSQDDICGMFIISMKSFPGDHYWGCPYK